MSLSTITPSRLRNINADLTKKSFPLQCNHCFNMQFHTINKLQTFSLAAESPSLLGRYTFKLLRAFKAFLYSLFAYPHEFQRTWTSFASFRPCKIINDIIPLCKHVVAKVTLVPCSVYLTGKRDTVGHGETTINNVRIITPLFWFF